MFLQLQHDLTQLAMLCPDGPMVSLVTCRIKVQMNKRIKSSVLSLL